MRPRGNSISCVVFPVLVGLISAIAHLDVEARTYSGPDSFRGTLRPGSRPGSFSGSLARRTADSGVGGPGEMSSGF